MYDPKTCSFIEVATEDAYRDFSYHFDNTYYINYYSRKALFAIEKLYDNINISDIKEAAFYYHIYTDMLFNAIGLINDRFIAKKRYSKILKENIEINKKEYDFSNVNYPNISDKVFRNFIEHINQKCEQLIKYKKYYGTFNFIHQDMNQKSIEELLSDEKKQNNILNLINRTYRIFYVNDGVTYTKEVSIDDLKMELTKIYEISNNIWNYLTRVVI